MTTSVFKVNQCFPLQIIATCNVLILEGRKSEVKIEIDSEPDKFSVIRKDELIAITQNQHLVNEDSPPWGAYIHGDNGLIKIFDNHERRERDHLQAPNIKIYISPCTLISTTKEILITGRKSDSRTPARKSSYLRDG
jgi:hypothetical protein